MSQEDEKDFGINLPIFNKEPGYSESMEDSLEVLDLQNRVSNLEMQLKMRGDEIADLQENVNSLKLKLIEKTNEAMDLQNQLRNLKVERDISLSWRFSQYYGKNFSPNSNITKAIKFILTKGFSLISSSRDSSLSLAIYDQDLLSDLKEFLSTYEKEQLVLIFSDTEFIESAEHRPSCLAQVLSNTNYIIIFTSWKKNNEEIQETGSISKKIFQVPLNFLINYTNEILSISRLSLRILMMDCPHPSLFNILSYANGNNWITIYDRYIDWETLYNVGKANWYNKDIENYIILNSDIITVVNSNLSNKIKKSFELKDPKIIPNASSLNIPDRGNWRESITNPPPDKKITIGYFGYLDEAWFDWDLIISAANRNPDWIFEIIGRKKPKNMKLPKNIYLFNKMGDDELLNYAKNWDVAVIPFKRSLVSLYVDPIELYEFMHLGLPVVAVGLSHEERRPYVWLAYSLEDFESFILEASKSVIANDFINEFISENSWRARANDLINLIDQFDYEYSFKTRE